MQFCELKSDVRFSRIFLFSLKYQLNEDRETETGDKMCSGVAKWGIAGEIPPMLDEALNGTQHFRNSQKLNHFIFSLSPRSCRLDLAKPLHTKY